LHTTDGGDHWDFQTLPAQLHGSLGDVDFLDRNLGIVGGAASPDPLGTRLPPLVLITEDGGTTWREVQLPPDLGFVLRVAVAP
jgi:photosystem II stability/assembly factor-like uncharacterized protein